MPNLEDRIRDELRRAAVPGDPSGVYEHVVTRRVRRHIAHQVGVVGLTLAVLAGSITGAWALSKPFRRAAVTPTPAVSPTPAVTPSPSAEPAALLTGTIFFLRSSFDSKGTVTSSLYSMNADGSQIQLLFDIPRDSDCCSVSPDGMQVAFGHGISEGVGGLEVANVHGTGVTTVTTSGDPQGPSWSADGRSLLFFAGISPESVFRVSASGGAPFPLTHPPLDCADQNPREAPTGTIVAFVRDCPARGVNDTAALYVMNADGTNAHRVTDEASRVSGSSWSPDGSHLALGIQTESGPNLPSGSNVFVMSADGVGLFNLTSDGQGGNPVWSPDGSSIAFESSRTGNDEIFVMNADGTNQRDISFDPSASDQLVAWVPTTGSQPSAPTKRPCTNKDYTLTVSAQGATMALVPSAVVRFIGSSPCHLDAWVSLRITYSGDNTLAVQANGGPFLIEADLLSTWSPSIGSRRTGVEGPRTPSSECPLEASRSHRRRSMGRPSATSPVTSRN